ncbi:high mobility group protein 20A [Anopheles bellator]|uniref:high mobility group protein 20A n=1 Tax=Anopheles bellator TaxID=139047 RepID=UPI002647E0A3|nr:high mobility group protein 20A [Anopheles bellator]
MEKEKTEETDAGKSALTEPKSEPVETTPNEALNSNGNPPENAAAVAGKSGPKTKLSPKKTPTKRKRRKGPKDANAPKHPLTGYVRYMNEHREAVRQKNPNLSHVELTKLMAEEWSKLPEEKKKPYLEAAEADKERYYKEISEYKLTAVEKGHAKSNETPQIAVETPAANVTPAISYVNGNAEQKAIRRGDYEIPIFTDDFLEHNRLIDSELRTLRKSNIDYEQQNSVLEKHVENMENGIQKLESETGTLTARNKVLVNYLQKLRATLASALQGLPLGEESSGATLENIDQYLDSLHQMADSSTQGHTLNKAKDIIRKLDLQNLSH